MSHRRSWTGFVALAMCGALVGCGSLAEKAQSGPGGAADSLAVDGAGADSLAVDGVTGAGDSVGGVVGADGTVTGSEGAGTAGAAGSSGSVDGSAGSTDGSGAGDAGAPGAPAAANKPIKLGITYPDTAAIAAAFGRQSNDAAGFLTKIIKYINKTGGISGRPIEPIYHKFGVEEDASSAGQRACAALTQDNQVDIVYNGGIGGETFPACLAKAGVSMLDGTGALDAVGERRIRNRFAPSSMRLDRQQLGILNISAQAGKIKKGDTLGLLVEDCDWGNRIYANVLEPRAKQLGLKVVKGTHRCVQNLVSDLGPVTNDVQRETLRFRSEGVTHALFVASGGAEAFVLSRFTATASQQNYYPKYFVSSNAYPFNNSRDNAPVKIAEDALPNVSGAGTTPLLDVGVHAKPANAQQVEAQKRCKAADPDEGNTSAEDDPEQKPFNRSTFLGVCDGFYALKAMLEGNGVRYGLNDVTRGFHTALSGNRTASANLSGGFFGTATNRLDGIGFLRPFAWDAKKDSFLYTGNAVAVP